MIRLDAQSNSDVTSEWRVAGGGRDYGRKEAQKDAKKEKSNKLLWVGCGLWKFLWFLCFLAAM
jgi:hypothetical protein